MTRGSFMKRRLLTGMGIAEIGALAVLWRSAKAAPLVAFEHDVKLASPRSRHDAHPEQAAHAG